MSISVDDSAAAPARGLGGFIDEESLTAEAIKNNPNRQPHPFRAYCERVRTRAGVPDTQQTREMTSHIAGAVARLPFLPDDKVKLEDGSTEFEQQVVKTAMRAEEQLDSEMVWTASARKLSQAALDLRKQDPDGKKNIAWVNDPPVGEQRG